MAGQQRKLDYNLELNGVIYKAVLTPVQPVTSVSPASKPRKSHKLVVVIMISLAVIIGGAYATYSYFQSKNKTASTSGEKANSSLELKRLLTQAKSSIPFPVYYPDNLPAGMSFKKDSFTAQNDIINFSLTSNGGTIIVTQQQRPPFIEETDKIKTVQSAIGTAYLSNVSGRTTGFIINDRTLVILSGATITNVTDLEKLLASFSEL